MRPKENNEKRLVQGGVGEIGDVGITEEQKIFLKKIIEGPEIVQGWENEIGEIDKKLKNKKDTKEQISLINRREVLNTMVSLIPGIKDSIARQGDRFKKVEERVEDYKKQKIEIDKETEVLMQETGELNKYLISTIEQLEREVDSKKELRSEDVVLLHIKVSKKIEQFKENIRILEKLGEINIWEWMETREESVERLSNAINNYANKIEEKNKKDGTKIESAIQKDQEIKRDGGIIGVIKRATGKIKEFLKNPIAFFKNKETDSRKKIEEEIEKEVKLLKNLYEKSNKDPENCIVLFYRKKHELYGKYGKERIDKMIENF